MEMMEAVEENTQAKNPMEGDQLVSKGGDDPEANPLHPQEVDVAGHRILKPTVKSMVTAYETHTLHGKKQVLEHISEEEWRLIRDTKIQASGKWITRDAKDGSSPQTTPRSPQRRGTNPPRSAGRGHWPDRITAGAVASAGGSGNPRTRGFTHGSDVSQSSCDLTAVLVTTWDKVPLRGSKTQQKAKKPDDGQAAERVGAEKADDGKGGGDEEEDDDEDDNDEEEDARFRAVKTWSAGTKLQRPMSIKASPASTFDEWMLQSREDMQTFGGESATARPSDSTALLSPDAPAAAGSDLEPGGDGSAERASAAGRTTRARGKEDRMRKSNSSGRERKKAGGRAKRARGDEKTKKAKAKAKTDGEGKKAEATTKQHKRRKSREKLEAAIVARSGDDEEDSGYVSPPHSPHKYGAIRPACRHAGRNSLVCNGHRNARYRRNAGSTPGPVRLVYEEGRGGNTNFTKINRKRR
ncbi:uncharacterized protein ACA1_322990 [Acanthamoeba castellanii str. Neff]|uniref:Uncharacterized protein n=1 Tax=Acanthamoeba castellanii (strain ATCC 30010 / Neff) TaxID=1257118 RepID=L8HAB2_ACACF|nr:uncharacterized protein ACA1_322990 [Acanthamoeba castellanii str. Neff]ELR22479.1 hypothetical protein ACA1_322990 [Acanthamoeba castellanii str. Neff]